MAALLYRRVADLCPEAVPPDVLATWRELAGAVAARSLRMQRQLLALLERLTNAGVPALVFKGPALSHQVYGDATLRHFSDLDVLVRPRDIAVAHAVAVSAGYVDAYPFDTVSESRRQTGEQELGLHHDGTGLHVDLHWRVGPRFAADSLLADELFSRSMELEILGREVAGLGPLDVVLVLAVHSANHVWPRIEEVAAFAAGLRGLGAAEAAELEALAAAHACRRRLHVGVLLAAVLAHTLAPNALALPAAADSTAKDLAAWAGADLLWRAGDEAAVAYTARRDRVREAVWLALALDAPPASARHLWNRLFTAGARDWRGGFTEGASPWQTVRTLARRQQRIWRR